MESKIKECKNLQLELIELQGKVNEKTEVLNKKLEEYFGIAPNSKISILGMVELIHRVIDNK